MIKRSRPTALTGLADKPWMRSALVLLALLCGLATGAGLPVAQAQDGRNRIYLPLAGDAVGWPLPAAPMTAVPGGSPAPVATWTPATGAGTPGPTATPNPSSGPTPALGEPITVPEDKLESWVYVAFPETSCGRGTASGLAVNFTKASDKVLIYFEGGGGCWDDPTCNVGGLAQNLAGISEAQLTTYINQGGLGKGIFDRQDTLNPFADFNFVYFPYCTGDFHLGNQVNRYLNGAVHHVGWMNVEHYLARVVPTFKNASQIALGGYSAGGLGVVGNTLHVANAFKAVNPRPPLVVDDAGPILRPPYMTERAQTTIRAAWGLTNTLETVCPTCNPTDGVFTAWKVTSQALPGSRISLLSSYGDQTVRQFYSLLNGATLLDVAFGRNVMDEATFEKGLRDLATWSDVWRSEAPESMLRFFYYPGTRHGTMTTGALSERPGLAEFLQAEVRGDASWANVIP